MKNLFLLTFLIPFLFSCSERIDAGHEGILVKQYGTDKGVQNVNLVTGRVWYNPWTEDVYQFPTFVQTADYEAFSVNAKDGSIFDVDPIVSYHVIPGESPKVFSKYRKDIEEIQKTVLLNYVKDAFKNVFNDYTTDSILSQRQKFDVAVTKLLAVELKKEGFSIDQLTFGMRYPATITKAIEAKNSSIQRGQQKENELRIAEADAKIMITRAEAEAKANNLKQQTLTPLLIQQQFIEKWNGATPLYGNSPAMFKTIQ
jgi:regulator of protease activity HflC (stomatin/prohibitin superfamily)